MILIDDKLRRSFGLTQSEAGVWLCACGAALEGEKLTCNTCERRNTEQAAAEANRRRIDLEVSRVETRFANCAHRGDEHWGAHLPAWPWARFSNAEFCRRVAPTLLRAYESYSCAENLLVSGKTGSGKTSLAVAKLHALRDSAQRVAREGRKWELVDFMFVSGPELAGARRRWKIGSESKLVETACEVGLLMLDELGFEPPSEEVFFVIDARYRAGAPTIITTGLPIESRDPNAPTFAKRYGAALLRRLLEAGQLVEVA